jgi:hypothetical protein
MIRSTFLRRFLGRHLVLSASAIVPLLIASQSAQAIVPVTKNVIAGAYDEAVRITNSQGARGTATLFGKTYSPDPANPAGNPQRYLNLCFLTADHVLRPLLPGGVPNNPDNDIYPGGSIYEDNPDYGGNYDPAPQPQPVLDSYVSSIGFQGINEPTSFDLTNANGIVARKVIMGDGLSGVGNLRADLAFAAVRVDLNNPQLTPAQKGVLNGLTPETLASVSFAPGTMFPLNLAAADYIPFSVDGGYGLSGRPDAAQPGYDYVYHPGLPADEQYGRERYLDNLWRRFVETNGFYNYIAAQWLLTPVVNQLNQQIDTYGVGLSGDSGAGLITGDVNMNRVLAGALTAGRMDKLGAMAPFQYGLKYGYSEIGAPLTQQALGTFLTACATFEIQVPEPATILLAFLAIVALPRVCDRQRATWLAKKAGGPSPR